MIFASWMNNKEKKTCKYSGSVYEEIVLADSEKDDYLSLFLAAIYIYLRIQSYSAIYLPLNLTTSLET